MTLRAVAAATVLIAIGAAEASVSAGQIGTVARPQLGAGGVLLSAAGLLASAAVYLILGRGAPDERAAALAGAIAGALAGIVGGAVRALIIAGLVESAVARYAIVPEWFVPAVLTAFVVLSAAVSVGAGAVLAWMGRRLSPAGPTRPPA